MREENEASMQLGSIYAGIKQCAQAIPSTRGPTSNRHQRCACSELGAAGELALPAERCRVSGFPLARCFPTSPSSSDVEGPRVSPSHDT